MEKKKQARARRKGDSTSKSGKQRKSRGEMRLTMKEEHKLLNEKKILHDKEGRT